MQALFFNDRVRQLRNVVIAIAITGLFAGYTAMATMATLFVPGALLLFIMPFAAVILWKAPQGRGVPSGLIRPLVLSAAFLMPFWPAYIHLQLGPAPILTPPRVMLYVLSIFWLWDMTFAPFRRALFVHTLRSSTWLVLIVIALFVVSACSVVIAEGKSLAAQEFFRQTIIWLLPFLAFCTYVRRVRLFRNILTAFVLGAVIAGAIAALEMMSGELLASLLSPLISDDALWLRIAQEAKLRDGVFRAQATHTHPLSLGEYLAMAAPLALAFAIQAHGARRRWLWAAGLVIILLGVGATNARGAFLAASAGLFSATAIFAFRALRRHPGSRFAPLAGLVSIMMIAGSPVIGYGTYKIVTGEPGTSAARSSQARIDQIKAAWPKILERPVGGHGTGRAARIVGYWGRTITIDNYYLSLAVDYGFPGPILFVGAIIIAGAMARTNAVRGSPDIDDLLYGFLCALIAFAVMRSIISQTGNLSSIYLLFGALAGVNARLIYRRAFFSRHRTNGAGNSD